MPVFCEDILKDFEGYIPCEKALKKRLQEKYGHGIIITAGNNREPIICFRNTGYTILSNKWYESREKNDQEERLRVVEAAAGIILEDMRSTVHSMDNYPKPGNFLSNVDEVIPESLMLLQKKIIMKGKRERRKNGVSKFFQLLTQ